MANINLLDIKIKNEQVIAIIHTFPKNSETNINKLNTMAIYTSNVKHFIFIVFIFML